MATMTAEHWAGVFPAITTPFQADGTIDHPFLIGHARRLLAAGCRGLIPLGSLGEAATLTFEEKVAVLRSCVTGRRRPRPGRGGHLRTLDGRRGRPRPGRRRRRLQRPHGAAAVRLSG